MPMIKAYIVDDEPLAREELKFLLHRSKQVDIVGESDGIDEALIDIAVLKPEIVFLDIELAEENGMTLAKKLDGMEQRPFIVFATAYDEYALEAFDVDAVDYILKPFSEARITKTLEKVKKIQDIEKKDNLSHFQVKREGTAKLALLVDDKIILLNYDDIIYLESSEGKCTIYTQDQLVVVSEALVVLEKKLVGKSFLRVHRSFIINLDHVLEIEPWFNSTYNLLMGNGSKVPVSRTYIKDLKQLLGI